MDHTHTHTCSTYEAQHGACLEGHKALAIKLDEAHELLLAPVRAVKGEYCTVLTVRERENDRGW